MSSEKRGDAAIRVITFSGEHRYFKIWKEKFEARAVRRGYEKILNGDDPIPRSSEDESALTAEEKKTKDLNEEAFADLILSMDTETSGGRVAFGIVARAKKGEYKRGNARQAWKDLQEKYEPTTAPTMSKLSQVYQNARLKEGNDPDVYITYLEDLRERLDVVNWEITDVQFMTKILNSLTKDYKDEMKTLEKDLNKTGAGALTVKKIREELNLQYERLGHGKGRSRKNGYSGGGSETALYAGGFKGRCNNCGKYGHKAADCRDKDSGGGGGENKNNGSNNNGGGFKGKCFNCGKVGHRKKDCPERKTNDDVAEVALMAIDIGGEEETEENLCSNKDGQDTMKCGSLMEAGGSDMTNETEVALAAIDFGDNEEETALADFAENNFGENEIPNSFFDNWAHNLSGPEDDDDYYEETALVTFDFGTLLDETPGSGASEQEGTSETAAIEEDDDSSVPSLETKHSSDDDSSACPGLAKRTWRWGDDDSSSDEESVDDLSCVHGKSGHDVNVCPEVLKRNWRWADLDSDSDDDSVPALIRRTLVWSDDNDDESEEELEGLDEYGLPLDEERKYKNLVVYTESDWGRCPIEDEIGLLASEVKEEGRFEELPIGKCPECGDRGTAGLPCEQCEDTGMIYQYASDDESEDEKSEISAIDHSDQVNEVLTQSELGTEAITWMFKKLEGNGTVNVRDMLIEMQGWVVEYEKETGKKIMTDYEQKCVLDHGIWILEKNAVDAYKLEKGIATLKEYQEFDTFEEAMKAATDELIEKGKSNRDEAALPVIEGDVIDGETALEACVKTPKMKRYHAAERDQIRKNTWIADSGASTHMGNSDVGMTDVREINSPVQIGNGKTLQATKIGRKHMTVLSKDGRMTEIVLEDYKYVPDLWVNLFAVTKCLRNGWNISNDGVTLYLRKGNMEVKFDKAIKTHKGLIIGVDMMARVPDVANVASAPFAVGNTIDVKVLHKALGHQSEDTTRRTAAFYGLKLTGKLDPCFDCAEGKSRQRDVKKETEDRSEIPGERLYLDQTTIKKKSLGGSKNWLLVLDDCTDLAWSYFLKKKSHQVKVILKLIKDLRAKGNPVKFIRCDNAGENIALEEACKEEGLGIQFEYTSPNSPQFNGRVERKFQTLFTRVRSNLNGAKVTAKMRNSLWAEAAQTSTMQENVCITKKKAKSSYELFYGKEMPGWRYMKPFGEIAVVNYGTSANKMKPKHLNRGRACFHLGRAANRPQDTYKFLNLETKQVIMSRDVTWMELVYGDYKKLPQDEIARFEENANDGSDSDSDSEAELEEARPTVRFQLDDDDDDGSSDEERFGTNEVDGTEMNDPEPPDPKVIREMSRLNTYYNSGETLSRTRSGRQFEDESESDDSDDEDSSDEDEVMHDVAAMIWDRVESADELLGWMEQVEMALNVTDLKKYETMEKEKIPPTVYRDLFTAPNKFEEAWNHPDPWQRLKWRAAITKEFDKMESQKVWKVIKRSEMPKGRRCVKHKWVFEIKRNGVFRARLVACGYSQVPGVDFTETYAPVVNDITVRLLLIVMIIWKFAALIGDVETAFLNGVLGIGEEIFMDCPEGMECEDDDCALLEKTIYGLVQSARAYFKKAVKVLIEIGFKQSAADPCLFVRRNELGIVFVAMWVDDCLFVGDKAAIDDAIKEFQKHFNLKLEESLQDYLSCEILFDEGCNKAWIGQPHLIKKIENEFGEWVKKKPEYRTPGTPHHRITKPKEGATLLSEDDMKKYRTGVGMLLYLVKYSRPDIANAVRELSKGIKEATPDAMKELQRVIKFVIRTRDFGLKMEPKLVDSRADKWSIVVYSDSDWAGDPDTRISVTGYILFVMGCAVSWKSKAQNSVSLSSSEAEWYALSEAAKEIKFLVQLMLTMEIPVELPVIVRVDNVGAIFMSANQTATGRTKHIDIRTNFVREYVEDGLIKIIFVKSEDNKSDGFTKNTSIETYERHQGSYVADRSYLTSQSQQSESEGCRSEDSNGSDRDPENGSENDDVSTCDVSVTEVERAGRRKQPTEGTRKHPGADG